MTLIPYTYWAYFHNQEDAQRCAEALTGYQVRVDRDDNADPPAWLLRAAGMQDLDDPEDELKFSNMVEDYGGELDGGEATFNLKLGEFVPDKWATDAASEAKQ